MKRFIIRDLKSNKTESVLITQEDLSGQIVKLYVLFGDVSPETRIEIFTSDNEKLCDLKADRKEILLYPRNYDVTREKSLDSGLEPRFMGYTEKYCNVGYMIIKISNVRPEDFDKPIIKILKIVLE